jgi:hypothetical protein
MGRGFHSGLYRWNLTEELMASEFSKSSGTTSGEIEVPASTAWPVILAFGLTLIFAGPVTSVAVSALGAVLAVTAAVGWFRQVLPTESHEWVPVAPETATIVTTRQKVGRIVSGSDFHRAALPLEIYPVSAGIKGGLAGSVAMALLATAYSVVSGNGIWYAMNLLAASFFPGAASKTAEQIGAFNLYDLLVAVPVHLMISLLVGLLYGALLPMLPRRPVLLGGFVAPVLWSGLIYSILGFVNPVLNQRINWFWFVLSQIGFGIVAGIIVSRQERVHTWQGFPLIVRAGIEAPGMHNERGEDPPR